MIQYDPKSLASVVLRLRGSIFVRMLPRILAAAAIGHVAYLSYARVSFHIPTVVHTLIGVALGLLLVFRTNASYDRYWEGRKLAGSMTNRCRDLCRQAVAYLQPAHVRTDVRRYLCAFIQLVIAALRDEDKLDGTEPFLRPEERQSLEKVVHRAPTVTAWISQLLDGEVRAGRLSEQRLQVFDQSLTALNDALGGAERIHRTPVPFAYAQHIKVLVLLFVSTAPFAIVDSTKAYTSLAAGLLAFALFGIDEIGVEIEDPFGDDPNDLPMETIAAGIERATDDILQHGAQAEQGSPRAA
jgi:ion channel-forming bestrophin family protein